MSEQLKFASMVNVSNSLISTVGRLACESNRIELGGFETYTHFKDKKISVSWRGKVVLEFSRFRENKDSSPIEVNYRAGMSGYVGWKLWHRLCCGCFASMPNEELCLDHGYDSPSP